jgi:hypothetical protein
MGWVIAVVVVVALVVVLSRFSRSRRFGRKQFDERTNDNVNYAIIEQQSRLPHDPGGHF